MTPEDILSHPARVLTTDQREAYFRDGFVTVEGVVPAEWLERLKATSDRLLDESRGVSASNDAFDIGP